MSNDPSVFTLLSAVTTTGAGSGVPVTAPGTKVYVYSAAGSSCTVLIQGSLDNSVWFTLATITNPAASPSGECWRGTSWPYIRANVSARASGTITAKAVALAEDPGAWASDVGSASASAAAFGVIKYTWTNAEVVAAGTGGTEALLAIGSLPANSQLLSAYIVIGTQATFAAGTLTVGCGRTSATYVDFIAASDAKAAAATIYGNAAAERATDAAIQLFPAATPVKAIFTAGAGDLANVTTSTGTIYLLYVVYP